jgi:hypothetical protein
VITDTATAHLLNLAAPTLEPHLRRPTNLAVNLASTVSSRATTATLHLLLDSMAPAHHHTRAKVATAKANTEARRSSMLANSIPVATDRRLASVDKVGPTMVEHRPADTDSKQAMVVQRRVTMAVQQTTTTTSTTRYVLETMQIGEDVCILTAI